MVMCLFSWYFALIGTNYKEKVSSLRKARLTFGFSRVKQCISVKKFTVSSKLLTAYICWVLFTMAHGKVTKCDDNLKILPKVWRKFFTILANFGCCCGLTGLCITTVDAGALVK